MIRKIILAAIVACMLLAGCSGSGGESQAQAESQSIVESQAEVESQSVVESQEREETKMQEESKIQDVIESWFESLAEEPEGLTEEEIWEEAMNPTVPEIEDGVKHIACVGDSITFGFGVWMNEESKENTYPAILERLLRGAYQTLNYGVCGTTLLKEGDSPYTSHAMYEESIAANADVYILMLGTNDSKPSNWISGDFKAELKEFVKTYLDLSNEPTVFLATPPKAFPEGEQAFDVSDDTIANEIIPAIKEVGNELGVYVFDMYEPTKYHVEWFTDGVHPDATGNEEMAKIFAERMPD